MRNGSRRIGERFHLLDWLVIGYTLLLALAIVGFRASIPDWHVLAAVHVLMSAVAFVTARWATRTQSTLARAVRIYFPAAALATTYLALDSFQSAFTGSYWFTDKLVDADLALLRMHPTVEVQNSYGGVADEVLAFFYLTYFVIGLVITARWLLRGRHREVLAGCAAVALTYVANFALFLALPALGPRNLPGLAELHLTHYQGWVFGPLSFALEGSGGSISGGVFPSLHVSAAVAWTLVVWRYERAAARLVALCAAGIALATVYLGYHHGVDPIAGTVLALICVPTAWCVLRRRGELP